MKVLLVEDNEPTRDLLCRYLGEAGIDIASAADWATGLELALSEEYDVLVLDRLLPGGDGLDLCRRLRAGGSRVPVLCLTSRAEVGDRVEGLEAGADDYLKKPFALAELQARIRALARRHGIEPARVLEAGTTRIDFTRRRLSHEGNDTPLTDREWRLLEMLAARDGRLVERAEILEELWPASGPSAADSLDVILGRLRRKLGGDDGDFTIRTLRGAGLVFERAR
ncbi:MAG: response regulator transcription factor [Candidatus Eisenbacteria bacterium]